MTDDRRFYVYAHYRKSDGRVFYVGKGCGDRLHHFYHKSKWWNAIVNKHGFIAKKIFTGLSESCAYSLEKILIEVNKASLCNIAEGGVGGLSGKPKSPEHIRKVALAQTGKPKSPKAKEKMAQRAKKRFENPENHPRLKLLVSHWQHTTDGNFVCNHLELSKKTGLGLEGLKRLQSGIIKSHKGWKCYAV